MYPDALSLLLHLPIPYHARLSVASHYMSVSVSHCLFLFELWIAGFGLFALWFLPGLLNDTSSSIRRRIFMTLFGF